MFRVKQKKEWRRSEGGGEAAPTVTKRLKKMLLENDEDEVKANDQCRKPGSWGIPPSPGCFCSAML